MPKTYVPIQTVTVSGTSTTEMTFDTFPSTYKDLVIVWVGAGTGSMIKSLRLNGETASHCSAMYNINAANYAAGWVDVVNAAANRAMTVVHVFGYSNTTTWKSYLSRQVAPTTSNEVIAGTWFSTAAVTSVGLRAVSNPFADGTTATLYGIKAA